MKRTTFFILCLIGVIVSASAQKTAVRGVVISAENNEPIIGASVLAKGTTVGTVTDFEGSFTLEVPGTAKTLVISYMGMVTQEVAIAPKVRVLLKMDTQLIDEVIVVAYGTVKKSSFTGAAANIKSEKLENLQAISLTRALEGAAPGIQISGTSGMPGSNVSIRVRGTGSIYSSSAPLYIVDGSPFDGDISTININDIENITVLKDATSAALYGSRGANGVIMITTKKGTKGKISVSTKAVLGASSRAIPEYDRVNTGEYYEMMWEGWRNALVNANGFTPENAAKLASSDNSRNGIVAKLGGYNSYDVGNGDLVDTNGKLNPKAKLLYQDDWYDALSRTGLRQEYNISANGGAENATYFGSASYNKEEGIIKWSDFERFTARAGFTSEVNSWLKLDAIISGATSKSNGFLAEGTYTTNPFFYARNMAPIYPVYQYDEKGNIALDSKGNRLYDMGGGSNNYTWSGHRRAYAPNSNLMVTLPIDERSTERNLVSARVGAEIKFLNDFALRITGNTDISNDYQTDYQNNKYGDAESVFGRSTKNYIKKQSYTFNQVLTWKKTLGKHHLSMLAGHENYSYTYRELEATRTKFTIATTELVAGSVAEGSTSYSNEHAIEGYFLQANYDYSDKYYGSVSFRRDGSSRFHKDSRWGSFWSVGGSWRISQEGFMSDYDQVDNLKLKASYGEQGNEALLDEGGYPIYYGWQELYSINDKNNANANGAIHSQLMNKKLAWEKNANLNAGVEFGLFDFVRGETDFFIRESSNLLFRVPNPLSNGIEYIWKNIGTMRNTGVELLLGFDFFKTKDLNWSIDINATWLKNRIRKMPKNLDGTPQEIITGTKKLAEGHSMRAFWLREYAGVDPEDGSALYYKDVKDTNGNVTGRETVKNQNDASYYYVGDAIPDLFGGITNTLSYKGIDLTIFLSYQIGGDFYDSSYGRLMHPGSFGSHWSADIRNRWQKPGDKTNVPRLQNNYTAANTASSRWLTDASYLSLKTMTLSYSLPNSVIGKLDMKGCKVYVTGDNLFLISKRKGMDPQQSFSGTSDYTYTPNRMLSIGVNVTF